MSNKLKQITARAKQLRKKNPGKKWTNLIKDAARQLKSGKTTNPNPKKTKKRKRAKRAVSKVAKVAKVAAVRKVGKSRAKRKVYKVTHKVRRVGATKKQNWVMPLLLIGAGIVAFSLFRKKAAPVVTPSTMYPGLRYTGDQTRDSTADQIVKYAQALGYGIDAITKLINSLNNSSKDDIEGLKDTIDQTNQIPGNWV